MANDFVGFTDANHDAIFGTTPDLPADDLPEPEPESRPVTDPLYRFIGGYAGTGKTYLVREEARRYDDIILCATSGIAAVNLGGTTINSLLWFYDLASLRTSYELGRLHAAIRRIADSRYTRIAIDECSMMDGAQLDILCMAFDEVNNARITQGKRPIGITLIADFLQLPPVGWGEKKLGYDGKPLPPIQFCFERPSWARFAENTTLLTIPRRQADAQFISALQAVRRGDALTAMEYFGSRLNPFEDPTFDGTTILAKNDEVDRYNRLRMMDLPGAPVTYTATRTGEQLGEWKNIPEALTLKKDALVMILVNKKLLSEDDDPATVQMLYANGDLAYFIEPVDSPHITEEGKQATRRGARLRLKRNNEEVVIYPILREKLVATGAAGVKAPRNEVKGNITYMPLRVAYATTVHKSQGLSLDNVQVMFGNHFFTHFSMLYVALSRARSIEGLRLVGDLTSFVKRCKTNPAVARWL